MTKGMTADELVFELALGDGSQALRVLAAYGGANRLDGFGFAPIHRACSEGLVDVLHFLLRHGADVERREANGWTPLHRAILQENVVIARELIVFGADVNAMGMNDDPRSPLLMAAFQPGMLALLVAAGAKPPKAGRDGVEITLSGGIESRLAPDAVERARHDLENARVNLLQKARNPLPKPGL